MKQWTEFRVQRAKRHTEDWENYSSVHTQEQSAKQNLDDCLSVLPLDIYKYRLVRIDFTSNIIEIERNN